MPTLLLNNVRHSDTWGIDVLPAEHAARCAYMTAWLTQHEGDALSILVRPSRVGEVEGFMTRGSNSPRRLPSLDVEDLTGGAVSKEEFESLMNRAWLAACEVSVSDADLHALRIEAGYAGDATTLKLVRAALEGDVDARATVTAQVIQTRAKALDET